MSRPKKNISELPDNWYVDVLSLYREGGSDVEVKALIYEWMGSFSNDLWDRWLKENEEFSETIKKGRILSEAWWNKSGRENLKSRDFNYTGWYMQMKNRFGWKDKTETDLTTGGDRIQGSPIVISEPKGERPERK